MLPINNTYKQKLRTNNTAKSIIITKKAIFCLTLYIFHVKLFPSNSFPVFLFLNSRGRA